MVEHIQTKIWYICIVFVALYRNCIPVFGPFPKHVVLPDITLSRLDIRLVEVVVVVNGSKKNSCMIGLITAGDNENVTMLLSQRQLLV